LASPYFLKRPVLDSSWGPLFSFPPKHGSSFFGSAQALAAPRRRTRAVFTRFLGRTSPKLVGRDRDCVLIVFSPPSYNPLYNWTECSPINDGRTLVRIWPWYTNSPPWIRQVENPPPVPDLVCFFFKTDRAPPATDPRPEGVLLFLTR